MRMSDRRITIYLMLIGSLLFGLFTGRPFFFNVAYLLGFLLVSAFFWSSMATNWVKIGRQTRNRRAQVGRTLDETFVVSNTAFLPKLWLEVRDQSTLPAHIASRVVPLLLPRRNYSWSVRTLCAVRGEFTLGPLTITSGDPFGLFQSRKHIPATSTVLVYPMVAPILDFAPPIGAISGGDARRQRAPFITTNASGVREYAPGDSLNRVHWKSSARQDRLMVKEFELDPQADTWVVLDLNMNARFERPYSVTGTEGAGYIPPSTEEYGIVIAASVAEYFLNKDRMLGFVTYCPQRTLLQPERGYRQQGHILETLATARSEDQFSLKELLALEDHHFARGSTITIVTADMSQGWMDAAYLLVRRGLRVAAVLMEPTSFGGEGTTDEAALLLASEGVVPYVVRNGDDIGVALAVPVYNVR
jgi:uncharacterized protein (DUF58 family)